MEKNILNNFQAQFDGFYATPHLFLDRICGLQPLLLPKRTTPVFEGIGLEKIRLGQRVERFVTTELLEHSNIQVIAENLQIRTENKQTIGELDVLYLEEEQAVHLEIQFKYYLYDLSLGETEIDHCVGPMRRDTLNQKLSKLRDRQLPLLHTDETQKYLTALGYNSNDFIQKIYFKAQLFIPYGKEIVLKTLNPACIYGYYICYAALEQLEAAQFYKPKKTDWLLEVTPTVFWLTYLEILPVLQHYQKEGYAPLVWVRQEDMEIFKCFVVP